jgi:hypothetical protein
VRATEGRAREVFHARRALDAAAHVHGVWLDFLDRRAHVLWRQPAGEVEAFHLGARRAGERPVERAARAAARRAAERVEQDRLDLVSGRALRLEAFADAQRLDNAHAFERLAERRRLVAVQLNGRDARRYGRLFDRRPVVVHEHADAQNIVWNLLDDDARRRGSDVAGAAPVEVEAERVRARLDRRERVAEIRDAADLDSNH